MGANGIVLSKKMDITPENLFPLVEERVLSLVCECDADPNQFWSCFKATRNEYDPNWIEIHASRCGREGEGIRVLSSSPLLIGHVIARPLTASSSWIKIMYEIHNMENIEVETQPKPIDSGMPCLFHELAQYVLEACGEAETKGAPEPIETIGDLSASLALTKQTTYTQCFYDREPTWRELGVRASFEAVDQVLEEMLQGAIRTVSPTGAVTYHEPIMTLSAKRANLSNIKLTRTANQKVTTVSIYPVGSPGATAISDWYGEDTFVRVEMPDKCILAGFEEELETLEREPAPFLPNGVRDSSGSREGYLNDTDRRLLKRQREIVSISSGLAGWVAEREYVLRQTRYAARLVDTLRDKFGIVEEPSATNGAGTKYGGEISGNRGGMTDERKKRASTFKTIKDTNPKLSYLQVAMKARDRGYPDAEEHDVRNDYNAMGWDWAPANKVV